MSGIEFFLLVLLLAVDIDAVLTLRLGRTFELPLEVVHRHLEFHDLPRVTVLVAMSSTKSRSLFAGAAIAMGLVPRVVFRPKVGTTYGFSQQLKLSQPGLTDEPARETYMTTIYQTRQEGFLAVHG